jgi:hypothetical protein
MTVITHRRGKSRLASMIDQAGGVSVGTALAQARANLETMREASLEEIRAQILVLSEIPAPSMESEAMERLMLAYQTTSSIIDAAGPFELDDLCMAATNLCDLIDMAQHNRVDWRIVTVHARAMQLLINLPENAVVERAAVLENLRRVLAHKSGGQAA